MIITWICGLCSWANDNNAGPCRRCGGQTEERLVRGKWKTITIKEPTAKTLHGKGKDR